MADKQLACMTCEPKGLCRGRGLLTLKEGAWANNPLAIQILGICSALAVTNRLENSLVMGAALIFVCVGSNLLVSLLRKRTPHRIRMIAELAIIGFFRELLGTGEIFGYEVLSGQWYTPNQLMILAPGAFFALGIVIAVFNAIKGPEPQENK